MVTKKNEKRDKDKVWRPRAADANAVSARPRPKSCNDRILNSF